MTTPTTTTRRQSEPLTDAQKVAIDAFIANSTPAQVQQSTDSLDRIIERMERLNRRFAEDIERAQRCLEAI